MNPNRVPIGSLVYCEWLDAHGGSTDWADLSEVDPDLVLIKSVGWLAARTKLSLTLVPHLSATTPETWDGCGNLTLPVSCIHKLVVFNKFGTPNMAPANI